MTLKNEACKFLRVNGQHHTKASIFCNGNCVRVFPIEAIHQRDVNSNCRFSRVVPDLAFECELRQASRCNDDKKKGKVSFHVLIIRCNDYGTATLHTLLQLNRSLLSAQPLI